MVVFELAGPIAGQIGGKHRVHIARTGDRHHARQAVRRGHLDPTNASVRVRAASEGHVHQARQDDVFEVRAATGNEPRILAAFDRQPEHFRGDHHAPQRTGPLALGQQRGEQRHPPSEALRQDVLVRGVGALALGAESVERGHAHGRGEVAVGAATRTAFV